MHLSFYLDIANKSTFWNAANPQIISLVQYHCEWIAARIVLDLSEGSNRSAIHRYLCCSRIMRPTLKPCIVCDDDRALSWKSLDFRSRFKQSSFLLHCGNQQKTKIKSDRNQSREEIIRVELNRMHKFLSLTFSLGQPITTKHHYTPCERHDTTTWPKVRRTGAVQSSTSSWILDTKFPIARKSKSI